MTPEIRDSLNQWLDTNLDTSHEGTSPYWLPLTMPTYGKEEIASAIECLCDYRTSMGEITSEFETRFAKHVGAHDAVMVNSGSSADLLLAFNLTNPMAPRLHAGDEILIPAVTWPTQIWSATMAGLNVKLVDVDPNTLNVDLDALRKSITPRTKCFFAVHLMGNPCDMDAIRSICAEYDLLLIEDCCESLGATYADKHLGNFGIGGSFSFFFSHHMTTMEGGMVTCMNDEDADTLRVLRAHGWSRGMKNNDTPQPKHHIDSRYRFVNWGFNVRPTELQAAFGIHQLAKLESMNDRRRELANQFYEYVDASPYLSRFETPKTGEASPFALPVILKGRAATHRAALTDKLEADGIETRPIVTGNIARQPAARLLGEIKPEDFPGAETVHNHGFYMGLSPMFDDLMIQRLVRTLDQAIDEVLTPTTIRKAG